jgi:hypothetical protein
MKMVKQLKYSTELPFYLFLDKNYNFSSNYINYSQKKDKIVNFKHQFQLFVHNDLLKYVSDEQTQLLINETNALDVDFSLKKKIKINEKEFFYYYRPKSIIEVVFNIKNEDLSNLDILNQFYDSFKKIVSHFSVAYGTIISEYNVPIKYNTHFVIPSSYYNSHNTLAFILEDKKKIKNITLPDSYIPSQFFDKNDQNLLKEYFDGKKIQKKNYVKHKIRNALSLNDYETAIVYTISYLEYIFKGSLEKEKEMDRNYFDTVFKEHGLITFLETQLPLLLKTQIENKDDKKRLKKWQENVKKLYTFRTEIIHRLAHIKETKEIVLLCESIIELCEYLEVEILEIEIVKKKFKRKGIGISLSVPNKRREVLIGLFPTIKMSELAAKSLKSFSQIEDSLKDIIDRFEILNINSIKTDHEKTIRIYTKDKNLYIFLICPATPTETIHDLEKSIFENYIKKKIEEKKPIKIFIKGIFSWLPEKIIDEYSKVLKKIYGTSAEVELLGVCTFKVVKDLKSYFQEKKVRTVEEIKNKEKEISLGFSYLLKNRGDGKLIPSKELLKLFKNGIKE